MKTFNTINQVAMSSTFFQPDDKLVNWLAEYAKNRVIFDIGCGNGHLLEKLRDVAGYKKTIGIEPFYDMEAHLEKMQNNLNNMVKILSQKVEDKMVESIIRAGKENILLVFARPCHSDFVENALSFKNKETEALYITVPENIERYDDLGSFRDKAVKIKHIGSSKDKEVIYSIK